MDTKRNILLVNRDIGYLREVSKSLTDAGYSILSETTMSGALDRLSASAITLVIGDCELADVDGYELLGHLKNTPSFKKIPFMFLVSARHIVDSLEEEVSKILKAFDMGAADFIVDTLEEDISRVLTGRIKKLLLPPSEEKSTSAPSVPTETPSTSVKPEERRNSQRIVPRQIVNIELSRDGVLWIPGQITNINEEGLLIETSLLGKLGMLLYVRVPLPGGKYITAKSHIRHIKIGKTPASAIIGVAIDESIEWIEIYNYVAKLLGIVKAPPAGEKPSGKDVGATLNIRKDMQRNQYVYVDPLLRNVSDASNDKALEMKFYRSLVGKQLGNYRVVSFVGAGSMAGVFKGWDIGLERTVALKVISYNLSGIASFRDMFFKEARLVSRLMHPNIAQIYHIDHMDDVYYFVMEFISGGTLADMIADRSKLNIATCLEHLITVCRTLDFVSKQNIVHRDIKPANIMLNDRGILKIVDFGVATVKDEANKAQKNDFFGTPLYISPECIKGQPLDFSSDIYSLGATFYHVLAGIPPFDGDSLEAITNKHLNEYMVPLKKINPMISIDLSDIVDKMMAKKPQERYQNYRSLLSDLTEVVH